LSIPFALLNDYLTPGEEGTFLGIFNVFVCLPQFISALLVGKWIEQSPVITPYNELMTHNWSIAFVVGGVALLLGLITLQTVKEKQAKA
jgi:hypothetical protein